MSSSWGLSWGRSWGNSWGSISAPAPRTDIYFWSADGAFDWSADGYPGWSADGYEPTPLEAARTFLAAYGLNVGVITYAYSDYGVPVGWVMTGYPPLLGTLPVGTYVNLVVSEGPTPPATVLVVPNVVGLYYYDAQLALLQAGFLIAPPVFVNAPGVVPGIVTTQSLAAGVAVTVQTQITITASGFLVPMQGGTIQPVP